MRTLQETDTELLYRFFSRLSPSVRAFFYPHPFDLKFARKITTKIEPHKRLRMVATVDQKGPKEIIGYSFFNFSPFSRRFAMGGTAVLEEHMGQGVGSALMASKVELARRLGTREIWATLNKDNARVIALDKKFGFQDASKPFSFLLLLLHLREGIYNYGLLGMIRKYIEIIRESAEEKSKIVWMVLRLDEGTER